jgi:tetratricopeptide (TPR) repeat protein
LLRAELLLWVANVVRLAGKYARAKELYESCLALRPRTGDADTLAAATHNLGILHYEMGDYAEAARLEREAVANARRVGSGYGLPFGLVSLGDVERAQGNLPAAEECYRESLVLFRALGHPLGVAQALSGLGHAARKRREYEKAIGYYRESLELTAGGGDPIIVTESLEGLAEALDRPADGVRLLGTAARLRERINAPRPPRLQPDNDRVVAALTGRLGPAAFAAAWQDGNEQTPDDVLDSLFRDPERPPRFAVPAPQDLDPTLDP